MKLLNGSVNDLKNLLIASPKQVTIVYRIYKNLKPIERKLANIAKRVFVYCLTV